MMTEKFLEGLDSIKLTDYQKELAISTVADEVPGYFSTLGHEDEQYRLIKMLTLVDFRGLTIDNGDETVTVGSNTYKVNDLNQEIISIATFEATTVLLEVNSDDPDDESYEGLDFSNVLKCFITVCLNIDFEQASREILHL